MFREFPTGVRLRFAVLGLVLGLAGSASAGDALRLSVYATAGDVLQYLVASAPNREGVVDRLKALHASRVFLEGRRGDEYVSAAQLREARDFLMGQGMEVSGGIATVPGVVFGVRQTAELGWLNWEHPRTREQVRGFFAENAPLFDELMVDDFYCTADTSEASQRARGSRSWSQYRQDLLVGLLEPLMFQPARQARPDVRLVLKFPQWYDRFHLFGYDPLRMSAPFDAIWVGTEVRDPATRRMGFVAPTQGYINFRWITAVAGTKVAGAWFDHIECSAQNFLDQAYQSVLAGARELTLFHLGDLVGAHPGDALLAAQWPELARLAGQVAARVRRGLPVYKPPGSDAEENLYLMDYLQLIGWPVEPVVEYPMDSAVAFLPVQAAHDPQVLSRVRSHLARGATLLMTPAFIRRAGTGAAALAGVRVDVAAPPAPASAIQWGPQQFSLGTPLEVDAGMSAVDAVVLASARAAAANVPWVTSRKQGRGRVLVFNARTFVESDFAAVGEWLLAPRPLGWSSLPEPLADRLRQLSLDPLRRRFRGPAGVGLSLFEGGACFYSFRAEATRLRWGNRRLELPPHGWVWVP